MAKKKAETLEERKRKWSLLRERRRLDGWQARPGKVDHTEEEQRLDAEVHPWIRAEFAKKLRDARNAPRVRARKRARAKLKPETQRKGAEARASRGKEIIAGMLPKVRAIKTRLFRSGNVVTATKVRDRLIADPSYTKPKGIDPKGERFLDYVRAAMRL